MARKDALLKLHQTLTKRRTDLLRRLGVDLADLDSKGASGDAADAAFGSGSEEIASQLAEFEARELAQINRALVRLKQGSYGTCEICEGKIPVMRLNALPYSTLCVKCQRELEREGGSIDDRRAAWDRVTDADARVDDRPRELRMSDLEFDYSR